MQPFISEESLLVDIIIYYKRSDKFTFYGKILRFNKEKVALIMDLLCHEKKISIIGRNKKNGYFKDLSKRFGEIDCSVLILENIEEHSRHYKTLNCRHAWNIFGAKIKLNMFKLSHPLDELSQLRAIDWASAIRDLMLLDFPKIIDCLRSGKPVL